MGKPDILIPPMYPAAPGFWLHGTVSSNGTLIRQSHITVGGFARFGVDLQNDAGSPSLHAPSRWGLCPEAIADLGNRLHRFWQRHRDAFATRTRDASPYALAYLSALLRLQTQRHFTNIGQATEMSSQNIQHFMSNSPWDARFVLWKVQREIARTPALQEGGVLILDESADEKASSKTPEPPRSTTDAWAKSR